MPPATGSYQVIITRTQSTNSNQRPGLTHSICTIRLLREECKNTSHFHNAQEKGQKRMRSTTDHLNVQRDPEDRSRLLNRSNSHQPLITVSQLGLLHGPFATVNNLGSSVHHQSGFQSNNWHQKWLWLWLPMTTHI